MIFIPDNNMLPEFLNLINTALESPKVQSSLKGVEEVDIYYVPDRLINFVPKEKYAIKTG